MVLWIVSANPCLALTQLGWTGVGDPLLQSDARSLSLGSLGLISSQLPTLSLSAGLSSVAEEISTPGGVADHRMSYFRPPSLRLILALPRHLALCLKARPVFDYNYDRDAAIYDDVKEDLRIGVGSLTSRGYLYASTVGIKGKVHRRLSFGCGLSLLAGWHLREECRSYYDPALWGGETREEEKLLGLAGELQGTAKIGNSTELAASYLTPQDLGDILHPSTCSVELLQRFGGEDERSLLLSLQRRDWSLTREGFSSTLRASLGMEIWMREGIPFRISFSSEPWYGLDGVERISLGLGTGFSASTVRIDLGVKMGSRSFAVDGEQVNELVMSTLLTGSCGL